MRLTITTPLLSASDVTPAQVRADILSQPNRTRYSDAEVDHLIERLFHWCGVFGFNPLLLAAQIAHETNRLRFTGDVKFGQHNFAGLGATGGVPGHRFASIDAGVLATVAHHAVYRWGRRERWPAVLQSYAGEHVDPRYDEVLASGNAGRMIVLGDYRGTWAVPGTTYPESIVRVAGEILQYPKGTPMARRPRLAIKAGHHNTSGGSTVEYDIVADIAEEYYLAALHQGFDVVSAVPDGPDADTVPGDGRFPGTLFDSAASIVGFNPDVYLSVHTQGGPKVPGLFGIYPDWGDDVDVDARDTLIPAMCRRMTAASGIGQWTDGVMSEKQTNVAIVEKARLGEFRATEPIKATCTRVIFEHGAHDVAGDLAKLRNPAVQRALARAGIEAIAAFLGHPLRAWDDASEPAPASATSGITIEVPGRGPLRIYGGIYEAWKRAGGLAGYGYPLNEEHDAIVSDAVREQDFQRGRAEWAPGRYPDNWDTTWALVNVELIEAREELAVLRRRLAELEAA